MPRPHNLSLIVVVDVFFLSFFRDDSFTRADLCAGHITISVLRTVTESTADYSSMRLELKIIIALIYSPLSDVHSSNYAQASSAAASSDASTSKANRYDSRNLYQLGSSVLPAQGVENTSRESETRE